MNTSYLSASPEEKIRLRQQAARLREFKARLTAGLVDPAGTGVLAPESPMDPNNVWGMSMTPDWSGQPAQGQEQPDPGYPVVGGQGVPQPPAPLRPYGGATQSPPQNVTSEAPTGQLPDASDAYLEALGGSVGNLGGLEDEQALLASQDARAKDDLTEAEEMLGTAMPEGRDSGRVYTAANPLEFVGAALRQYRGGKDKRKANEKRDAYEVSTKEVGERRKTERNKFGAAFDAIMHPKRKKPEEVLADELRKKDAK